MATWSSISFPNSNSPIMEQLNFFHDHSMMIITMITIITLYMIINVTSNTFSSRFMMEGQEIETLWTIIPAIILIFIAFPSLRLLYLISNFMGLFPYIFTPTSHINITSFMAIPLWLTFMAFGWINFTNSMFSHLVPLSTPIILSSFMFIIETISNMIRPMTLAIRLSANVISVHLLLCLLSNTLNNLSSIFPLIAPLLIILLILESAVAIIQSYVFITLSTLYLNETN